MIVLIWILTILLIPFALLTTLMTVVTFPSIIVRIAGRVLGKARAEARTERATGIVDGGSLACLPSQFTIAHATWEDGDGSRHSAIGPVISSIEKATEGKTRIDGTTLLVAEGDWETLERCASFIRRMNHSVQRGDRSLPHDVPPEQEEVLRCVLPRLREKPLRSRRTTNPDESAKAEYMRRMKESDEAERELWSKVDKPVSDMDQQEREEVAKLRQGFPKSMSWGELAQRQDYEYLWANSPVALVCPEGTEVEVAYDSERPDDARIICEGGTDGTFVSVRDILLRTSSWMGFCGLAVASVSAICALHGWKLGWVVAAVAVLVTVVTTKEDANRPWNI